MNRRQELVIGGYIPGPHGFDSLIVGYYRGKDLVYVARVRNGFVPASRRQVFEKIRCLVSPTMPFVNLPDRHKSRWGDELTAEKMRNAFGCGPRLLRRLNSWIGRREIDSGTQNLSGCGTTKTLAAWLKSKPSGYRRCGVLGRDLIADRELYDRRAFSG